MKNLSALIPIILFIAMILYIGKFNITFKPFHIGLPQWFTAVGYALFILGGVIIVADTGAKEHHKGVMEGIDRSYEDIHKVMDDMIGKENVDAIRSAREDIEKEEK